MRLALAMLFVGALVTSGSLGAPFARDEIAFSSIQRESFDAVGVVRERGDASREPLVVRVQLLGDARDADLRQATAWLLEHANVRLVPDEGGAPLYLTRLDLSATSGRTTLGATLPTGMAVEMADERLAPCVLAHEVLHFLGLHHVRDAGNIMHPQCMRDKLATAKLSPAQREELDELDAIVATTTSGIVTWASR